MSRDRLGANELTDEQARDIIHHVARERLRWGKHYTGDDVGLSVLLDALIHIARHENQEIGRLKDENASLKEQLTMSRSRKDKGEQ